jgi:MFS family permease
LVKKKKKLFQKISILVPVFGICVFIILYLYAASLYPGSIRNGSVTEGFSFTGDYWCDLLDEIALNGEVNDARPAALISTIILSWSLSFFWYYVPLLFKEKRKFSFMTRIFGVSSMILSIFIFTPYHDTILNFAGLLGFAAFILTLIGLSHAGRNALFSFGFFCMVLILMNYAIWNSKHAIEFLPFLQKITFAFCFTWIISVMITIFRHDGHNI